MTTLGKNEFNSPKNAGTTVKIAFDKDEKLDNNFKPKSSMKDIFYISKVIKAFKNNGAKLQPWREHFL